jgi:flagellar basal-body rod protein FlgB
MREVILQGGLRLPPLMSTRFTATSPQGKIMGINFKDAAGVHADALALRAERTRILAANIANENTPGFQAQDMDFAATLANVQAVGNGDLGDGGDSALMYRVPYHPTRDGNTVEIGVEQAAFSQNATDFATSLTFVNMRLKGLAKAINGQ